MPSLLDALTDFGSPRRPPSIVVPVGEMEQQSAPFAPSDPAPDIDLLLLAEARRVEIETEERLTRQHEAVLRDLEQRHRHDFEALAADHARTTGEMIASRLEAMETNLLETLSAATARVLGMVATEAMRERSLGALVDAVREALRDPDAARLTFKGPQSMFDAVAGALGEHVSRFDFVDAETADLSVSIGPRVLETKLGEWSRALSEIIE